DGVKWVHIKDRSTQIAALQAGQLDVAGSGWNRTNAETAKKGKPELTVIESDSNVNDNVLINAKRAPLTDERVRRAINLALDRKSYLAGPRLGAATFGGAMQPRPSGVWGLPPAEVTTLPGMGDPAKQKTDAKKLLAAEGARPILGWGKQYAVFWPRVKAYPQHENSIFNVSRLQDVWLDK